MNLRKKLMIAFLIISIIPVILSSSILGKTSIDISDKKVGDYLRQSSKDRIEFIDQYISSVKSQLDIAAGNINVINESTDYVSHELKAIADSNKDIGCVYVGLSNNKTIGYPDVIPDGYNQYEREWYKKALEDKGKYIITEPYVDAFTGKTIITISKYFKLSSGQDAAAAIDISIDTIYNNIAQNKIGNTGEVILVSNTGKILVHSNKSYINKNLSDLGNYKDVASSSELSVTSGKNASGEKVLLGYNTSKTTGWKFICSLPEKEYASEVNGAIKTIVIINIVLIALVALYCFVFSGKIASVITAINKQIKTLENGELNCEVNVSRKDELGSIQESLNSLAGSFKNIIANMRNTSYSVKDTSNSLINLSKESESANTNISRSIEEIAIMSESNYSSVEEINASVEETLTGYKDMAENISNLKEDSKSAVFVANTGSTYLDETIVAMDKIENATEDMGNIVKSMEEYSTKIDFILGTITSIADQTNLLALNAAIEAARAGESGRGFAVVADEVRKLAEDSSNSANEIAEIIKNIKMRISDASEGVEIKKELVKNGKIKTEEVKENLKDIVSSIERVDEYLERINMKTKDQTRSIEEIAIAIETVSSSVEQSVSLTETIKYAKDTQSKILDEMNNSIVSLNTMAEGLENNVRSFKMD